MPNTSLARRSIGPSQVVTQGVTASVVKGLTVDQQGDRIMVSFHAAHRSTLSRRGLVSSQLIHQLHDAATLLDASEFSTWLMDCGFIQR